MHELLRLLNFEIPAPGGINDACSHSIQHRFFRHSAQYEVETERRAVNAVQKEIGAIKKAKGDASELLAKKAEHDKKIAELQAKANELNNARDRTAARIGNIVDPACHVSLTEVSHERSCPS